MSGNSIGIIELASIHKGFETTDAILKLSKVEKLLARTICSGKFLTIVRGEIADVEESVKIAEKIADYSLISARVISNVDERIFPALTGSNTLDSDSVDGMLVIETFSASSAIEAADRAVKEADVCLLRIHVAMAVGGKAFIVITGNIDALKSAQVPALEYVKEDGTLAGYSLITQPHPEILRELI